MWRLAPAACCEHNNSMGQKFSHEVLASLGSLHICVMGREQARIGGPGAADSMMAYARWGLLAAERPTAG